MADILKDELAEITKVLDAVVAAQPEEVYVSLSFADVNGEFLVRASVTYSDADDFSWKIFTTEEEN